MEALDDCVGVPVQVAGDELHIAGGEVGGEEVPDVPFRGKERDDLRKHLGGEDDDGPGPGHDLPDLGRGLRVRPVVQPHDADFICGDVLEEGVFFFRRDSHACLRLFRFSQGTTPGGGDAKLREKGAPVIPENLPCSPPRSPPLIKAGEAGSLSLDGSRTNNRTHGIPFLSELQILNLKSVGL